MIDKGRPGYAMHPITLAVHRVALMGGIMTATLLAGCQEQADPAVEAVDAPFDLIGAPEVAVGDPLKGELRGVSPINFKDGSRLDQHWLCPSEGNAAEGTLYRLDAPFEASVSVFDKSGDWLGRAESTAELPAKLLVAPVAECALVVISGKDRNQYGPYAFKPVVADAAEALTDGQTVAGHLGEESNSHAFSLAEPRHVALTLSGARDATLTLSGVGDSETEVLETGKHCGDAQQTLEAFLNAGDYRVTVVTGQSSREKAEVECNNDIANIGEGYRLHLIETDPSRGERNQGPLRNGDQISGVLAASTTPVTSNANRYSLSVEEPTLIDLAVKSSSVDTVLNIQGNQISLHSDDAGVGSDSRIESVLLPGEYSVDVSSYGGGSGAYELQLSTTPFDGELRNEGVLEPGATILGMARPEGNFYTLSLEQPSSVEINLGSSAFDTFLDVNGNDISLSDDDGAGDGTTNSRLTAILEAGEYQISASSYAGGVSGGMYELSTVVTPFDGELINNGELKIGQSVQGNLSASGYNAYEFEIDQRSMVTLDMTSPAFDTYLELTGDDIGHVNDDFGSGTDSRIQAVLEPGAYEIGASSYSGSGMFTLSLDAEPYIDETQSGGVVHIGGSVNGQLESGGTLIYQLLLDEKTSIVIEAQSATVDTRLELEGETVSYDDDGSGSTSPGAMIQATLSPGIYIIRVTGREGDSGQVQLDINDASEANVVNDASDMQG